MKGYKGMTADMQCRGMQYEVGKYYHTNGDIEVCSNGLHFCENLINVFDYYRDYAANRFFEVEAFGVIKTWKGKSAASDLLIIRELTDVEINRAKFGNGCGHGRWIAPNHGNGYYNGDEEGYGYGYHNGYSTGNGYGNGNGYDFGFGDGSSYGYYNIQEVLFFI